MIIKTTIIINNINITQIMHVTYHNMLQKANNPETSCCPLMKVSESGLKGSAQVNWWIKLSIEKYR